MPFDYRNALFEEMESRPDEWFWLKLRRRHDAVLKEVAEYLGSEPENMVKSRNRDNMHPW